MKVANDRKAWWAWRGQRLFVGLEVLLKKDMIRKGKERKQRKPRK